MGFLKDLQATMMRPDQRDQWSPINGVDLDRYAWLVAQLQQGGFAGAAESQQWLATQGVAHGTWAEIHAGWTDRRHRSFEVSARYRMLSGQYSLVGC